MRCSYICNWGVYQKRTEVKTGTMILTPRKGDIFILSCHFCHTLWGCKGLE